MARITANGIEIEYEEAGKRGAPAILLVHGLGAQLTLWPDDFVERLAFHGFHVVRYDNRDIGLSQKFDSYGVPRLPALTARVMAGERIEAPYLLSDMAADGMALAEALDLGRPHVVGVSMGGMIAQHMAGDFPARVASLTSIMSSSGRPGLPQGDPQVMSLLLSPPAASDRETVVSHGIRLRKAIAGPSFLESQSTLRTLVERNFDRSYHPQGAARQYNAILASGSRVKLLKGIKAPTLVIHGSDDPVVPVEAGRDTAALVPGARLEEIEGMGHDLPTALLPKLANLIADHARLAK